MNKIGSVEDIMDLYGKKEPNYIYRDKEMDNKGIDYKKFLKIKYDSINKNFIRDLYTVDGWYVLFWLMSSSNNAYYATTTINMITEFTGIRATKVKDILLLLHNKGVICIVSEDGTVNDIKNNTPLNVCILYNSDCNYLNTTVKEGNGYIAMPVEFLKNILPMLSSTQWAVYSMMLVNYSFFGVWTTPDAETGEPIYHYYREHYAYPTQRQIGESLGINKETINLTIKELGEHKYNLIKIIHTDAVFHGDKYIRGGNNRYRIPILERIEWVYHNIYLHLNEEQYKYRDYINSIGGFEKIAYSSNQSLLHNKNYLYIMEYYMQILEQYRDNLNTKDRDKYMYQIEQFAIYR